MNDKTNALEKSQLPIRLKRLVKSIEERQSKSSDTQIEKDEGGAVNTNNDVSIYASRYATQFENAQRSLIEEAEKSGKFVSRHIQPESEYPTFLTRLPIFIPSRLSNQKQFLDKENAFPFETSWGEGRRHGPPLTVYDEDTLIAIGHLRQKMLIGQADRLPIPVHGTAGLSQNDVQVHVLICQIRDIQEVCKVKSGGKNDELRLSSVKRLSATTIEWSKKTADKLGERGTMIDLLKINWETYEDTSYLYIQISPLVSKWFDKEYTWINWNIRMQLSATGKAIHRFLSGQRKSYKISTRKLMQTIGFPRDYKEFMRDLRASMAKLENLEWVEGWEISGNGKSIPHQLTLTRK